MKKTLTTIYRLYATIAVRIPKGIVNDSTFDKKLLNTKFKYPIEWKQETKQIIINIGKGEIKNAK